MRARIFGPSLRPLAVLAAAAAAMALLLLVPGMETASAQYRFTDGPKVSGPGPSMRPSGRGGRPVPAGPRHRGPNWGGIAAGAAIGVVVGSAIANADRPPPPPPARAAPPPRRPRAAITVPPGSEQRFVPDEVLIELAGNASAQALAALAARHRLVVVETRRLALTDSTWLRARIADGRPVRSVLRALAGEGVLRAAQPNYVYRLMDSGSGRAVSPRPAPPMTGGDPAQYALGKLRLFEAHGLARGADIVVAVIDSGVDAAHPELKAALAGSFDAIGTGLVPHAHGTAIAGAIAARGRLLGAAPAARILAIQAFDAGAEPRGTTFAIGKGLDHAGAAGARVVNMSFAGPADPALSRQLAVARSRGLVLIAAVGNAGPKSPPLYPAADRNVIAVTATDAADRLFAGANRGSHVDVAAPGVEILLPAPERNYQLASGTSVAAAYISGVAALILERRPGLSADQVRRALLATANDLGPVGRDPLFGAGLADAYRATAAAVPAAVAMPGRR